MWPSGALLFNVKMSSTKSRSILAVQAKMGHCVWDIYYRLYSRLPLLYNNEILLFVSFSICLSSPGNVEAIPTLVRVDHYPSV